MLTKVYGGTAVHDGESLCHTCRNSQITRGRQLDEEVVFCDARPMRTLRVTFKVTTCTEYIDQREPGYHELMEKAWILRPGTRRRAAGFVRGSELIDEEASRPVRRSASKT
jgi:hypothetical protein